MYMQSDILIMWDDYVCHDNTTDALQIGNWVWQCWTYLWVKINNCNSDLLATSYVQGATRQYALCTQVLLCSFSQMMPSGIITRFRNYEFLYQDLDSGHSLVSWNYFGLCTSICMCVHEQGGGTPTHSVLWAATAVRIDVNSQLEIFFMVNSQAIIYF